MIRTTELRAAGRESGDFTTGCGRPPEGVTSGRVCAGTGKSLSCQLCPHSPTFWDQARVVSFAVDSTEGAP